MQHFPCPKCGRTLEQTGEATIAGRSFPVFQCDTCIVKAQLFGETFDSAYTFALDESGKPFDPAAENDPLRN